VEGFWQEWPGPICRFVLERASPARHDGSVGWVVRQFFLQYVAGFGIGTYTFRALYWVIGISVFGALYLRTCAKGVRDGHHGFVWCFGASLARLLPVIEINKEFTEFFNDPGRKRLPCGWMPFSGLPDGPFRWGIVQRQNRGL
jgi:hypothetical protein